MPIQGTNQIRVHLEDEEKIAYMINGLSYCYKAMLFVQKNAEATNQRLMDKVFAEHIGRNIEVYIDDMVAKTSISGDHCRH